MPFAKADVTIDAVPTAAEIDRALAKLETVAQERGVAVGVASALPISIERIGSLDQDAGEPWHHAGAIDNRDAEIKIELDQTDGVEFDATFGPSAGSDPSVTARGADGMARYEDLPYRTCVGMMLINAAGLVFIGRRAGGIEHVDETHVWQMPQGGVDPGEDTWDGRQARALRGDQRPLGREARRGRRTG